ncbi:MAG: PAS domain S-box protein, partial [Candidatus Contubernalis sp.]|nr:PAS domain S-box protein [Candidatus Contubernalis sp.]
NKNINYSKEDGLIGVDINYDHLAIVEIDRFGNILDKEILKFNLEDKTTGQSVKIIEDIAIQLIDIANNKNPVAEKLTGWKQIEAKGKPLPDVFKIFNAHTREPVPNPVQIVLKSGSITGLANDTVLISRDSTEYQIADSAAPILGPGGRTTGVVMVFRDITGEYRSQKALMESEERFQKMLALIPDMISVHDPDMNIIYSNWNGFASIPEEKRVLHTKCYRTYRGLDYVCPDCKAKTVLETKEAFQAEVELPEGIWVDLRVIPVLDDELNVQFFVGWVRDITAVKKAEQELKAQQRLLEGVIDGVSDVLSIQYPDHIIERYNQAGYNLLGMTPEEIKGKKCYQLIGRDRECEGCITTRSLLGYLWKGQPFHKYPKGACPSVC